MREVTITANDAGQRLDRFLKKYLCNAPLSLVYKAIRKDVKVNGKRAKEETVLAEGDVLQLYLADGDLDALTEKKRTRAPKRQFTVAYEDDNVLVVCKPFGLLVHGDSNEKKDTLANQAVDYLIEKGDYVPRLEKSFVPSPVHRLDRNTTGLVVFGKNAQALRTLSAALAKDEGFTKYYSTIVCGALRKDLHLKNKLLKDEKTNKVRVLPESAEEGKYIETVVRPVFTDGRFTLVEVQLVTGRSHQIRAHLKSAGYPLIGDAKYGDRRVNAQIADRTGLTTQLLHARRLVFTGLEEPLAYLNGVSAEAPLPPQWAFIQKELFGKEIL
ncbi:MAG: RluA family pseudouridine synthase [Firmicutes bacterium]|nr:RluA family pseudouridine synthase [Bacillota bacterium]